MQFAIATLALMAPLAAAHRRMAKPAPFRSTGNLQTGPQDYSYSSPLDASGSNYPCKGYHVDLPATNPVDTMTAGSSYTVNFDAYGAVHAGGSCEFSVSYDSGATFAVIHRIVGSCQLANSYTFNVPAEVPGSDKALFAWTWFNNVGNREMYMNCAPIAVKSSSTSYTGPALTKANVGTGCATVEGRDPNFFNILPALTDFLGNGANQAAGAGFVGCSDPGTVTVTSSGSSTGGKAPSAVGDPSSQGNKNAVEVDKAIDTASAAETPTANAGTPISTANAGNAGNNAGAPVAQTKNNSGKTGTSTIPTPTGRQNRYGQNRQRVASEAPLIKAQVTTSGAQVTTSGTQVTTSGDCSPGAWRCSNDGLSWAQCVSDGTWMQMGSVAAGMKCVNGEMVLAKRTITKRHLVHRHTRRRALRPVS